MLIVRQIELDSIKIVFGKLRQGARYCQTPDRKIRLEEWPMVQIDFGPVLLAREGPQPVRLEEQGHECGPRVFERFVRAVHAVACCQFTDCLVQPG